MHQKKHDPVMTQNICMIEICIYVQLCCIIKKALLSDSTSSVA